MHMIHVVCYVYPSEQKKGGDMVKPMNAKKVQCSIEEPDIVLTHCHDTVFMYYVDKIVMNVVCVVCRLPRTWRGGLRM